MNTIQLTGRITNDLELKVSNSGKKYVNFTIAVSRGKNKDGANVTDFIPCVSWNKTAETLTTYCKKGKLIGIVGRLNTRTYEKNGERRYSYEILVNSVEILEPIKRDSAEVKPFTVVDTEEGESAELPFSI